MTHVLDNVLQLPMTSRTSRIRHILLQNNIVSISVLVNYLEEDLRDIEGDFDGTIKKLQPGEVRTILHLQEWGTHEGTCTLDDWYELNADTFDDFLQELDDRQRAHQRSIRDTPHSSPQVMPAPPVVVKNPAVEFSKGTKRNLSDYPILKEDKGWYTFNRTLHAVAASHGVSEVLDPTYTSQTAADEELFKAKNVFIYNVLIQALKMA